MEKVSKYRYLAPQLITNQTNQQALAPLFCQICLGIVRKPAECSTCETLFCEDEITEVKEECPLCRSHQWKRASTIHKSYRGILSTLTFKCQNTACKEVGQQMKYDKIIEHLEYCPGIGQQELQIQRSINKTKTPWAQIFKKVDKNEIANQFLKKHSQQPFYSFAFENDKGQMSPYKPDINATLNMHFRMNNMKFQIDSKYQIDLEVMTQKRKQTHKVRKISKKVDHTHKQQVWWFVEVPHNLYQAFQPFTNAQMENQYQEYLKDMNKNIFKFKYSEWTYQLNFKTMMQKNMKSGKERKVLRSTL